MTESPDLTGSPNLADSLNLAGSLGQNAALDLTAPVAALATAMARLNRLLPARALQPVHAGVLLRADDAGMLLVATDGELSVRIRVPATTHTSGQALVSRRGLADTVARLDVPEVRLTVEGSRLALRTPGARFALPQLGDDLPEPAVPPRMVGEVSGSALRAAAVPVAGAASREHALPIFTGVRLRSDGDRVSLLATDRYRLASATLPWQADAPVAAGGAPALNALVPAAVLAEVARQAGRAEAVTVHADEDLFALAWDGGSVVTGTLGPPFPDAQLDRLLVVAPDCSVEVDADALAAAVERAVPYGGDRGRVTIQAGDGGVLLSATDPLAGDATETVKATVRGDHLTRSYQARFLLDALRPFAGHLVALDIQAALRPTRVVVAAASVAGAGHHPEGIDLNYLIVPMRTSEAPDGSWAGR